MPWDPGERPAWVQHAIDGDGGPEYALAAEPLDADELVAEAAFRAGTDDFGDDSYVEALDVAVRSIEEEGDLHIVGRWRVREAILRYLESRARAARCLTTDPSIEARPIEAPIVVSGSPRAGTSIMHELLAAGPGPPCADGVGVLVTRATARSGDDGNRSPDPARRARRAAQRRARTVVRRHARAGRADPP